MPYYKDQDEGLHFIDSIDFEHLLPLGSQSITDEEVNTILDSRAATAAAILAATTNGQAFLLAVRSIIGDALAANAILKIYPEFFLAIDLARWEDTTLLVQDALTNSVITSLQYTQLKAAAVTYNIPLSLI